MRAITGLTVGYVILIAALMLYDADAGSKLGNVIFGEVAFSSPMVAGWSTAEFMEKQASRHIMLVFSIAYPLFSALAFYAILAGEHDAQWQLEFLLIPMVGFSAVLIFGVIAAAWRRPANPSS